MDNSLIINDASLPFDSCDECIRELGIFFKIIHLASSEGISFKRADEKHSKWNGLNYADGFIFAEWLNQLDSDDSKRVKNILGKMDCPIVEIECSLRKTLNGIMYSLSCDRNIEVSSLGIAYNVNSHALSFSSHINWLSNTISIVKSWDENNEWKDEFIEVPNISSLEHIRVYIAELTNKRQKNKDYLKSLVTHNNKDFPNIIFCRSALKNFLSQSVTVNDYTRIIEVLGILDKAIVNCTDMTSLKNESHLDISGESKQTMANSKYARQRKFKHPDLGEKTFEQHVKNFNGGKRMHILPDFNSKNIAIGYFGNHLQTKKFND